MKRARRKPLLVAPEVVILSYPKSGRTWLAFLVTGYISRLFGNSSIVSPIENGRLSTLRPERRHAYARLVLNNRTQENWAPIVSFSHKDKLGSPFFVPIQPSLSPTVDLILLLRNPRDILVSHYHHIMSRHDRYPFEDPTVRLPENYQLGEFIRSEHLGIRHILRYVEYWSSVADKTSRPIFYYEDFVSDTPAALASLLTALGVSKIELVPLQDAVEAASFERLSSYERKSSSSAKRFRRGLVGGYTSELTASDCAYLDEILADADIPALRRYSA